MGGNAMEYIGRKWNETTMELDTTWNGMTSYGNKCNDIKWTKIIWHDIE